MNWCSRYWKSGNSEVSAGKVHLCAESLASMREDGHHPESLRGLPGRSATELNGQAAKEEVPGLWREGSMPEIFLAFRGEKCFSLDILIIGLLARNDVRSARALPAIDYGLNLTFRGRAIESIHEPALL
jgi:hypothetical protein